MFVQLLNFLESNGILALLVSIVTSFLSMLLVMIKTRTSSIQKKSLHHNSVLLGDYVVVIKTINGFINLGKADIRLLSSLTQEERRNLKEIN